MAAILTHSGRMVDLLDVKPEDIDLDDIAHALAQTCRFCGHTKRHYSVAEHSINVARLLPDAIKIYGLLHDAHEAYVGDISTPLKRSLPVFRDWLANITDNIDEAIYAALGVPLPGTLIRDAVKYADATMAVKEMQDLFDSVPPGAEPFDGLVVPRWSIDDAEIAALINWRFRTAVAAAAEVCR